MITNILGNLHTLHFMLKIAYCMMQCLTLPWWILNNQRENFSLCSNHFDLIYRNSFVLWNLEQSLDHFSNKNPLLFPDTKTLIHLLSIPFTCCPNFDWFCLSCSRQHFSIFAAFSDLSPFMKFHDKFLKKYRIKLNILSIIN